MLSMTPPKLPPINLREGLTQRMHFRIGDGLLKAFTEKCQQGYPTPPDDQFRRLVYEWLSDGCQAELFPEETNLTWDLELEDAMGTSMNPRIQPTLLAAYNAACESIPEKSSVRARKLIAEWLLRKKRRP